MAKRKAIHFCNGPGANETYLLDFTLEVISERMP